MRAKCQASLALAKAAVFAGELVRLGYLLATTARVSHSLYRTTVLSSMVSVASVINSVSLSIMPSSMAA